MNHIVLHWSYGYGSVPAIINKMEQPCIALAKRNRDISWWAYVKSEGGWLPTTAENVMKDLRDPDNHIINWGNHIFNNDSLFDLQPPKAVALASNKSLSRRVLQNAGVAVPRTYFPNEDFTGKLPIIARPAYHHAGKHFHVITTPVEYNELAAKYDFDLAGWYFSEIFPKTHEYRLHVAHGKVLAMYEKPLIPGEIRGNFSVNHESWRVLRWSEYRENISRECINAVEELGLDYGAVDVMYDANHDAVAIAEVNTSPQTTWPYLAGKYAAYFDWVIRHNFPSHYPVEGTSVFYNKILES